MKILGFAAFTCGALMLANPALAGDTASSTISLVGEVEKNCSFGTPDDNFTGNGVFQGNGAGGGTVSIDNFSVIQDGKHYRKQFAIVFPSSMCNYAAYLGLQSSKNGLRPGVSAPAGSGFIDVVYYTATASWGGATTTLTTASGAGTKGNNNATLINPTVGNLTLTVVTEDSSKPLIADGSPYTDTLTLQIGSQL